MLKNMKIRSCALAIIACSANSAMAADSVDVHVIGTITPAACTPTLSGGGNVDYGTIQANTLSKTDYTVLAEKTLDMSITCDAPVKVAVKAINGRPNSAAGSTEGAAGFGVSPVSLGSKGAAHVAGLGLDGTTKVGGYNIAFATSGNTLDGASAGTLISDDNGTSWAQGTDAMNDSAVRYISWGNEGSNDVKAFTTMNGKLLVQGYINKASELDLSKPVALDGLTTIEIVYL
ncbi:DUF1120 domain-containing protein [Buttiauxella agrestis]|uniref:Beta-fimbriae putative major subunit n=1 Tax=Buttiauxella agrestis ATCC 33320 TaxID=1006004 RepID=A0A085FYX2_9ENTR|nr:DUF1120 domain-containing protein [Buttiauxella agrestis]KFC76667.1 beta-fimbriae putative major subunit [Buttiauxella agrestis ATCC 33320]